MPLDPSVKAILDALAANPQPKMWQLPVAQGREAYEGIRLLNGNQSVPIGRVEPIEAQGPAGPIRMRGYYPVAGGGARPVILFFHGGGFTIGSLETHDDCCRRLADESGCPVISVDYRLAPEHKFPAALEDAMAALRHVQANASALSVDPNAIAVAGVSAGANLSAVLAQLVRDGGGPRICLQLLMCPFLDATARTGSLDEFAEGYFLERRTMEWFLEQYLPDGQAPEDPRISPAKAASLAGLPPAIILTAECDPLRDDGKAYADLLSAAGVDVTYVCAPGMIHDYMTMAGAIPRAREDLATVGRMIAERLG